VLDPMPWLSKTLFRDRDIPWGSACAQTPLLHRHLARLGNGSGSDKTTPKTLLEIAAAYVARCRRDVDWMMPRPLDDQILYNYNSR